MRTDPSGGPPTMLRAAMTIMLFVVYVSMLAGLPLAGIWLAGRDVVPYLELPPRTRYVEHAPFSFEVFITLGLLIALCLVPFILRIWKHATASAPAGSSRPDAVVHARGEARFPWWGYAGLCLGIAAWILAWTRLAWFNPLQPHTFTPLWIAYIMVISALTSQRTGTCMLADRQRFLALLFPVSTAFWWFFEYLNRFVQNWYYIEVTRFSAIEYVASASVSFATVLPAVLCTREYLQSFSFFDRAFGSSVPVNPPRPRLLAAAGMLLSVAGLVCLGIFPNTIYPLLWVAPLALIVCLQVLANKPHVFCGLATGNWSLVITSACAALLCGFFWEMWNFYSLAKWIYAIPYVQRFHFFEMPLLGYAGYLPFGLECVVISSFAEQLFGPAADNRGQGS